MRRQATIKEAFERLVGGMEGGQRLRENLAVAYWEQVVGPAASAASAADYARDGILHVRTKSSVWSQELALLKSHIIPELNRRIGRPAIRDIHFRAHGLKKPAEQAEPPPVPSAADLAAVRLTAAEAKALDRDLAILNAIKDDKLRRAALRRATLFRKIRHWRLQNGWRICSECGAVHRELTMSCPLCRVRASSRR